MKTELELISEQILKARNPEDVFGQLNGDIQKKTEQAKTIYRHLAKCTHPDRVDNGQKELAKVTFETLTEFWNAAKAKIEKKTYGNGCDSVKFDEITITTRKRTYRIFRKLATTEMADIFEAKAEILGKTERVLVEVAISSEDNEFWKTESVIYRSLMSEMEKDGERAGKLFISYLPKYLETFSIPDPKTGLGKTASAYLANDGFFTLSEVHDSYPAGVNPRDMAWMWNRLLEILGYIHSKSVIHGSVTLPHILIHPESHGAILADFKAGAMKKGEKIKIMDMQFADCYPPEVTKKLPATSATDIYMSAMVMVKILGGDSKTKKIPESIPVFIRELLLRCLDDEPKKRPQNAWEVRDDFEKVLKRVYGERKYHHFSMPNPHS